MSEEERRGAGEALEGFAATVAALRDPERGCPWDRRQTHATLRRYVIEECCELAEAIDAGDDAGMREELGDVLLQVALHAQLGSERGAFTLEEVIQGIDAKMIRRHPHVFGDASAEEALRGWEAAKRAERGGVGGVLDGVPRSLPSLQRAQQVSARAATVGFDWPEAQEVLAKIDEELGEVREALAAQDAAAVEEEIGDLLFSVVNLARKCGIQGEDALRGTVDKFERRFRMMEAALGASGRRAEEATLEELEGLWVAAKEQLKREGGGGR